jgi:hypothetical protein
VEGYNEKMRVYLDLCCLKRPFDDQSHPRIQLENAAVLALLGAPADRVEFLRAPAHDLENNQNPLAVRAERVRQWLMAMRPVEAPYDALVARTAELMGLGFKNFDAFHLASAEGASADVFVTCDDRLLAAARRHAALLRVRVASPVELATEIFP